MNRKARSSSACNRINLGFRAGVDVAVDPGQSTDPPGVPTRGLEGAFRDLDLSLAGLR
jgi:hypothetical protein